MSPCVRPSLLPVFSLSLAVSRWSLRWIRYQVPGLNVEVKVIPFVVAAVVHLFMLTSYLSCIFSGGVGKNGSTVAVSRSSSLIPSLLAILPLSFLSPSFPSFPSSLSLSLPLTHGDYANWRPTLFSLPRFACRSTPQICLIILTLIRLVHMND